MINNKLLSSLFKLLITAVLFVCLFEYANLTFVEVIANFSRAHFGFLSISAFLFLTHTVAAFIAWQKSLALFQIDAQLSDTLPLYGFSTLTKYLPGGIWHAGSRVYVMGAKGYAKAPVFLSILYESLIGIALSAALLFLVYPLANTPYLLGLESGLLNISLPVLALLILMASTSPTMLRKSLFWYKADTFEALQELKFSRSILIQIVALYLFALFAFVLAYYFSFIAYLPNLTVANADFAFIVLLATFSGFIAIFAPAGLGVRESILYVSFFKIIDDPILLSICLAPRLVLLLTEIVFFLFTRVDLLAVKKNVFKN